MARSEGQKLKLLYLKELLEQESDERHPVNVQKMLEYLASHGIEAERKAIYKEIYQKYILPCVKGVKAKRFSDSKRIYMDMVTTLKAQYT